MKKHRIFLKLLKGDDVLFRLPKYGKTGFFYLWYFDKSSWYKLGWSFQLNIFNKFMTEVTFI